MRKRLPGLRLGVVLLFMIGLLSPFAAVGAGAQELTCDDFNSQRAAQAVLEADPSLEESLDPDGDGEACNEDEPVDGPTEEATEEPTDDPTEEPSDDPAEEATEEPTDDPTDEPSGDADAYLSDIQAELDALTEQANRFVEISELGADITREEAEERNDIAADWVEYPDVAAELVAPEGYEDIEDAYLDLADTFGEAGELWETYWAIPAENDDEEQVAIEAFLSAFADAEDGIDEVQDLLDDAGGSTTPTDDPTEEPSDDPTEEPTDEPLADGDAYVADVQAELDDLREQVDRFNELYELGADATEDDLVEINEIAATWVEYPDVAAEFEAPDGTVGFEGIEDAYLDLADTVGEAGELWEEFWAIDPDLDDEEQVAFDAFSVAFADAQAQIDEVQDLLDDAGGSTTPGDDPTEDPTEEPTEEPTEDPADDPTEEPSGDADEYLTTVSDTAADWQDSVDRFSEIISLGPDATEAEFTEAAEIVTIWLEAPDVAAELVAPEGFEEIQLAYEDYADELSTASGFFSEWVAESESAAGEDALDSFIDAITEAETLYAELDGLLTDAGA